MTGPERDDELEAYLQQRTILPNRLADAERFEPPEELDRLILARAKEAIRTSAPTPAFRASRWAFPFGLAATLILAFAVILHMGGPSSTPITASAPSARIENVQVAMDNAASSGGAAADSAAPADAAETSTASPAQDAARDLSEGPSQEAPVAMAQANAITAPYSPPEGEQSISVTSAPRAESARAAKAERADDADAATHARRADEKAQTASRDRQSAASSAAADADSRSLEQARHADPARWLEEVRRLRRAGRQADADRELAEFRKAYPDYPVPADANDPRPSR